MTAQQIVDSLEAGTLVIPADYREILQAIATQINAGGGSGWAVTGTTTLTGATVIDTDGNGLEFNGDVVIKNRVNDLPILNMSSVLNQESVELAAYNLTDDGNQAVVSAYTTDTDTSATIGAVFNNVKSGGISCTATTTEGIITLTATEGINAVEAIPAYANNAAAVAAIGAGKLYYTDVAGEYIVKMSH